MEAAQSMEPPSPATAPDWTTHGDEIRCPMCEYNLRGLTEARCPECGYRFEWKDLLDAKARPHPYLFEHHPERNFKSFWQTAWGGLRPSKFWSTLHAGQRSKPGRLLLYWLAAMLVATLTVMVPLVVGSASFARAQEAARTIVDSRQSKGTAANPVYQMQRDRLLPMPPSIGFFTFFFETPAGAEALLLASALLLYAAWPWFTLAVLMIFRISMRRAKIRPVHVLRCALYSFDAALWAGVFFAITFATGAVYFDWFKAIGTSAGPMRFNSFGRGAGYPGPTPLVLFDWTNRILLALFIMSIWRLIVAYRKYLRFDRPIATVIASQLILLLALFTAILWIDTDITRYWLNALGLPTGMRYYWWMY